MQSGSVGGTLTDAARPATAYALTPEQEATLELADKLRRDRAGSARPADGRRGVVAAARCSRSSAAPDCWASRSRAAEGGPGLDVFSSALILQGLSRWNPAVALSWLAHENLCVKNILRNGDAEQRRRYLPGLADGTLVGALALTEPGAGSDAVGGMATDGAAGGRPLPAARPQALHHERPDRGRDPGLREDRARQGARGISAFIVEKGFPGFAVAQKLIKMGCRGSPTGELVFDDCRVPVANRIGAENAGVAVLMSGLDLERAVAAAISVGAAERLLELSLAYARERKQFGKPIAEFQMIQAKLADMYVGLETMKASRTRRSRR